MALSNLSQPGKHALRATVLRCCAVALLLCPRIALGDDALLARRLYEAGAMARNRFGSTSCISTALPSVASATWHAR